MLLISIIFTVEMVQEVACNMSTPIVHASLADPYLVIASEDGQFLLLLLQHAQFSGGVKLVTIKPKLPLVGTDFAIIFLLLDMLEDFPIVCMLISVITSLNLCDLSEHSTLASFIQCKICIKIEKKNHVIYDITYLKTIYFL